MTILLNLYMKKPYIKDNLNYYDNDLGKYHKK